MDSLILESVVLYHYYGMYYFKIHLIFKVKKKIYPE